MLLIVDLSHVIDLLDVVIMNHEPLQAIDDGKAVKFIPEELVVDADDGCINDICSRLDMLEVRGDQ